MPDKRRERLGLHEVATKAFHEDFAKLLSLGAENVSSLADQVNTETRLDFKDEESLIEFIRVSRVDTDTFQSAYKVAMYILRNAIRLDLTATNLLNELREYCQERSLPVEDNLLKALSRLFTIRPELALRLRAREQAQLALDTLTSTVAAIDLRAIEEDRKTVGYVPMVIIQCEVEDDTGKKSKLVFQTHETGLTKFREQLQDVASDLRSLRERVSLEINLIDIKD